MARDPEWRRPFGAAGGTGEAAGDGLVLVAHADHLDTTTPQTHAFGAILPESISWGLAYPIMLRLKTGGPLAWTREHFSPPGLFRSLVPTVSSHHRGK